MQTIIKLESRIEVTPSGARRVVTRRIFIKPTDPNYPEEKIKYEAFLAEKDKTKYHVNQHQ